MTPKQTRQSILQVIDRIQGNSGEYVPDTAIAEELKLQVEDVQGHLEMLEEEGKVELATSFEGASAFLTPRQRGMFREEIQQEQQEKVGMQVQSFDLYNPSMVRTLTGMVMLAGNIHWQLFARTPADQCEGVRVQFPLSGRMERRRALQVVQQAIRQNQADVLERRGQVWILHLDRLRQAVPDLLVGLDWATGSTVVEPDIEFLPDDSGIGERTAVRFTIYKEEYVLDKQQRIFLSHKGADKPQVRRFFTALKTIGLDPWLDEDAMTAGVELERGILQGFKDSCAAVFFITPNFVDEGYLRTEVNYAMGEKRAKGDRFAIVTIVFTGKGGKKGAVPELLKQYVWKEPESELEALNEVLRALPIEPGESRWRV